MKRLLFILVIIASCICLLASCEDDGGDKGDGNSKSQGTIGLEYALNEDGESYSVVGIGSTTETQIIIGSLYMDKPVTRIGQNAFQNCENITYIVIPRSIEHIESYVFQNCDDLNTISYYGTKMQFENISKMEGWNFGWSALVVCLDGFFLVEDADDGKNDSGGLGDDNIGGGINDDGTIDWSQVDFKGATVKISVSVAQNPEVSFSPAVVYLKGPDSYTTDEVLKKVAARNKKVEDDLKLKVEYDETDLTYDQVLADIRMKVQGSSTDAPDLYNNDMYGLNRAIIPGYLMNLVNPTDAKGDSQTSYFDFTYNGWDYDFMQGATLDSSKVYILAGDYYLDMIRMAQVIFVNKTMFNQNAAALGAADINEFYDCVKAGIWDYTMLKDMCKAIWKDDGTTKSKTDVEDSRVGLAISHQADWIFPASTGLTPYYLDEDGKAALITDIDDYNKMGNAFRQIWNSTGTGDGVYQEHDVITSITYFMDNRFLFAQASMGELESDVLCNVDFEKGLAPFPKYDHRSQDEYHTMVHDQTELGAVLVTTTSFARTSAFMQYANEKSRDVLTEYYEFSLKFKYNDDPAVRTVIDCIYNSIDVPFGMQFESIILEYEADLTPLYQSIHNDSLSNQYASNKQAYGAALEKALADFAKLP